MRFDEKKGRGQVLAVKRKGSASAGGWLRPWQAITPRRRWGAYADRRCAAVARLLRGRVGWRQGGRPLMASRLSTRVTSGRPRSGHQEGSSGSSHLIGPVRVVQRCSTMRAGWRTSAINGRTRSRAVPSRASPVLPGRLMRSRCGWCASWPPRQSKPAMCQSEGAPR